MCCGKQRNIKDLGLNRFAVLAIVLIGRCPCLGWISSAPINPRSSACLAGQLQLQEHGLGCLQPIPFDLAKELSHDTTSPTYDRGYASAPFFSAHAVHAYLHASVAVRPSLRPVTSVAGTRADPRLPAVPHQPQEDGAQLDHRRRSRPCASSTKSPSSEAGTWGSPFPIPNSPANFPSSPVPRKSSTSSTVRPASSTVPS